VRTGPSVFGSKKSSYIQIASRLHTVAVAPRQKRTKLFGLGLDGCQFVLGHGFESTRYFQYLAWRLEKAQFTLFAGFPLGLVSLSPFGGGLCDVSSQSLIRLIRDAHLQELRGHKSRADCHRTASVNQESSRLAWLDRLDPKRDLG